MSESEALQNFMIPGGNYGYTAVPFNQITNQSNTLAIGLADESGSTNTFARQIELCIKSIVKSLRLSPTADSLIYRHCQFGTRFREHHGYLPLNRINEDDYDGCYQSGGSTHLYDSCERVIRELIDYAEQNAAQAYNCNGIIYILTDGCDWGSTLNVSHVKKALADAIASEALESLVTILIGINDDPKVQADLQQFQKDAGFTQYIEIGNASEKSLAKLGNFVSKSIVAQSKQLGSGGPSQPLTF